MNTADLHFLVVEDQDFQRVLMVCTLAAIGARHIIEADNGLTALEILQGRGRPIDVIVSDLDMPGMDGMEFIRHIGEEGFPVSMILTSAHDRALLASVGTMAEAYGINLLGTIEKPITPQKLEAVVKLYEPPLLLKPKLKSVSFSEEDIAAALASRHFEPLFQPKINMTSATLVGAEALARWSHPHGGTISPYAFIPALETNRRIDELTWIMLEKAACACHRWRAAGLDMTVSVNLSLASLTNIGFADRISALVEAQELEPRHIILEVTETIAMTDMARALENLARLRIKGFGLSIDDYGTGYSSMQQLSRIPFTELKIDQSFVTNAIENQASRVILESSLDIARKLGLNAVAEGVETLAIWQLLKDLGCDVAQGYFIAVPMAEDEIITWAARWTAPDVAP